jgi:hypothetical protein
MPNNICIRRLDDALPVFCEMADCEQIAAFDCYPAVTLGVTSLQTTIALCEQHAREADPGLQREAQHG